MSDDFTDQLLSDEFVVKYSCIATPSALYLALRDSEEVKNILDALDRGMIQRVHIYEFFVSIVEDFEIGKKFIHEIALCAFFIVLEAIARLGEISTITQIAALDFVEYKMAILVAREIVSRNWKGYKPEKLERVDVEAAGEFMRKIIPFIND